MNRYKSSQAGFTFIEIAIVLLIGAILLASGAGMLHIYMLHERMRVTQNRMQEIDDALVQYLNASGVLPCVAGMTDLPGTGDFGVQITVAAGHGGTPAGAGTPCKAHAVIGAWTETGLTPPGGGSRNIIIGAVPVATLGLPDQDIADAWGNRFAYVVTENLTITRKYNETEGTIRIKDSSPTNIAPVVAGAPTAANPAAQYAVISYGPDGAGSYTLMGVPNGKACPLAPPELETPNCKIFKNGPFANLVMTMKNSNDTGTAKMFDDYVIFHTITPSTSITPMGLVAPMLPQPVPPPPGCPSGWQPYAGPDCTASAPYICCEKY